MASKPVVLRYDGRWKDMPNSPRQWTIMSHYIDKEGCDRLYGSFGLEGLKDIGLLKGDK